VSPLIGRPSPAAVNNGALGKQNPAGPSWKKRADQWRRDVTQWTAAAKKERCDVTGGRRCCAGRTSHLSPVDRVVRTRRNPRPLC